MPKDQPSGGAQAHEAKQKGVNKEPKAEATTKYHTVPNAVKDLPLKVRSVWR